MTDYIIKERGEEIISLKDKETPLEEIKTEEVKEEEATTDFTEVNFEDLGNDEDK